MKKIAIIMRLLLAFAEDFFILAGLSAIIGATFYLNIIAGWYTVGVISIAIGYLLSRKTPRKG
ncbi:hypothetical protein E0485_15140 [Paenibacillus albiflavus]|uniref:DUF1056 family protein n=1 Tax=Paenibacillus albiflavus TaxID=2545760 RepID=A0A4R4EB61_9BACL|nr:hypothetical protein [Paenibacillus albiflavus]TCZ76170.1 hypothetical protein E0485_15140 [Paenibacillus albiflavus]